MATFLGGVLLGIVATLVILVSIVKRIVRDIYPEDVE